MAAYFLRFRLNHKTSSIIPDSDGYAPFPGDERNPRHPYNWTVVCDVRGRIVVRETDRVVATGTWVNDWDIIDPVTRTPEIPSTEAWVFIAEHLRKLIAAPACKQHHASPDWIDDGEVEQPKPAPHARVARESLPSEPTPIAAPAAPPAKKFGFVGAILGTFAVLIIVVAVIVYYAVIKPTVTHPNRRLGEMCTLDIQCASDHCKHLKCVAD